MCQAKEVFNEICLNNNLPLNKKTGECDTEFTLDKCHKLGNTKPKPCDLIIARLWHFKINLEKG